MLRPINKFTTDAKAKLIDAGLYRPARLLIDHLVDRRRLEYRRRRQKVYRQLISPGDLCFDVGANIGDYTESLVSLGARVIAVEPQPSCIKELQARFAHNDRIIIVPVALGANEGWAEFFLREQTWLSGFIKEMEDRKNIGSILVPIKTLDQLITTYGTPKYIKIDVEGYELPVIMGLHSKVELISFEYCLKEDDYVAKRRIIEYLQRFGELRVALLRDRGVAWTIPWAQPHDFLTLFPGVVPEEAGVGDIFVQMTDSLGESAADRARDRIGAPHSPLSVRAPDLQFAYVQGIQRLMDAAIANYSRQQFLPEEWEFRRGRAG